MQVPAYLGAESALKAKGVDEVIVYCVNDCAVMKAWAESSNVEGSFVTFAADKSSVLTKALDMELTHDGFVAALGNPRCKRFAVVADNGVITSVHVSETPDAPAGDPVWELSGPDAILKAL